ncbi:FKBP-type peptidyl-prolyl cis-trans isomerase [Cellulomonas palmilytica]|nr:FKBP-type peptidyl-prolyl cis-trans isomerase [Cellulomonas palmilytica]
MRRARGALAAVCVAAVALTGCSDSEEAPPDVVVTGDAGVAPTLTYVAPLQVTETYREAVWQGTGPALVDGAPILIDYWLENASEATLVRDSFSGSPRSQLLTRADLGADLYETLSGQRVGARLLQVAPASERGDEYPTATVIDVLPTRAEGSEVEPLEGFPAVGEAKDGAPTFTPVESKPPATLRVQPVLRGAGKQVVASDTVTVQFTGWAWTSGEEFDSTWASGGLPLSFSLQDVPAWQEGLVDQPVGSRVMLIVPPSYALGVTQSEELSGQTVVFVVDILNARTPGGTAP